MVDTFTDPSSEEKDDSNKNTRDALRKQIRAARSSLSKQQLAQAASALLPNVLAAIDNLNTTNPVSRVAGYLAFQGEIDVSPVMDALRTNHITTYVPMLDGQTLQFAPWSDKTPFTPNRFGIVEPDVPRHLWITANQLDVVLVPLVAFDNTGNRMGMGGGFYDRTFAHRRKNPGPPWLIGVGHEFQRVKSVHAQWWDVALDKVLTNEN